MKEIIIVMEESNDLSVKEQLNNYRKDRLFQKNWNV